MLGKARHRAEPCGRVAEKSARRRRSHARSSATRGRGPRSGVGRASARASDAVTSPSAGRDSARWRPRPEPCARPSERCYCRSGAAAAASNSSSDGGGGGDGSASAISRRTSSERVSPPRVARRRSRAASSRRSSLTLSTSRLAIALSAACGQTEQQNPHRYAETQLDCPPVLKLITRRSRVRIPPPIGNPRSRVQGGRAASVAWQGPQQRRRPMGAPSRSISSPPRDGDLSLRSRG